MDDAMMPDPVVYQVARFYPGRPPAVGWELGELDEAFVKFEKARAAAPSEDWRVIRVQRDVIRR